MPLHKALIILIKLILFSPKPFHLDDTNIKRFILQTKLATDGIDPRIPHSYLVRIFTNLFNESTGKDLFNLEIYKGNYEEEKFNAYLQECGTFADTFVSHLATATLCDDCPEEKQYFRTEPIFFCDSLAGDGVLVSSLDVINEKLVCKKPILNWSCDIDDCKSKAGKMTVVVVVFPRVLVISFNRRNNKHHILKGPIRIDNELRLYPYANGAEEGTFYDLVSVLPYQGETIITKYGANWKEINVSGPSIKNFAFKDDTSSDSCSLLFYVRREQNKESEMEEGETEEEEEEEGGDDEMSEENDEEEEEESGDMDEDDDGTNGGKEFEKDAAGEDEEEEEDNEEKPSTFADDNGQEDEEIESSVKDKNSLSTGHRGAQIGKSSIGPIAAKPTAPSTRPASALNSLRRQQPSPQLSRLDMRSVKPEEQHPKRSHPGTPTSARNISEIPGEFKTRRQTLKVPRKEGDV
jgi:hypothetical protein